MDEEKHEEKAVEVSDLTFYYPGKKRPVLQSVSLSLNRGDRCIIVGLNGSGKSTLLKILAGEALQVS